MNSIRRVVAQPRAAAAAGLFTAPRASSSLLLRTATATAHRSYSSSSGGGSGSSSNGRKYVVYGATMVGFFGLGMYLNRVVKGDKDGEGKAAAPKDWKLVAKAISDSLDTTMDDGSMGPIYVRLAWHASGSFDKATNAGGSDGANMRFSPESSYGANAGLGIARDALEKVKKQFPWVSYADLWIYSAVVAIKEMGGPTIPFRPGRTDADQTLSAKATQPDGRLPDASKNQKHIRDIFYRMGFNDQEIVALAGAHALGRCHTDRSGYSGPWTRSPTTFTNDYFKELLNNKWRKKKWSGPEQYEDPTGELMMLPADLAFIQDKEFKKWVEIYAKDETRFFADFAKAAQKLFELGVNYNEGAEVVLV